VGRALRDRGHEAVIATSPDYAPQVAAAGLEFAPIRPSIDSFGDRRRVTKRLLHPLRGTERLLRDIVMPYLPLALEDTLYAAEGADLLVSHPLTFAVPIVAHRLQRPWVSTVLAPLSLLSKQAPPRIPGINLLQTTQRMGPRVHDVAWHTMRAVLRHWERPLHRLRAANGLADTGAVMMLEGQYSPDGTLALFDEPLATPAADRPTPLTFCGPALYDGHAPDARLLGDLKQFLEAGTAPLVFALGSSAVWIADRFWPEAIRAAQQLGRRAILVSGETQFDALPPGIRAFSYVPYSQVFPHAAVVIHQAGIGTLSQALRAGRPQLITPVAFDQPDNAERVERMGIARVVPFQKVTAEKLKQGIDALLRDGGAANKAAVVAEALRGVEGAVAAADWLVKKVAESKDRQARGGHCLSREAHA
jgi:hypothetical protein